MKKNKNILILIMSCTFVTFLLSCEDKLDLYPLNELLPDDVYNSAEGYKSVLAKVYASYTQIGNGGGRNDVPNDYSADFVRSLWNMQELPTDDAQDLWGAFKDLTDVNFNPGSMMIQALFQRNMFMITTANEFIAQSSDDAMTNRNISESDQSAIRTYRAEARFVRALGYWVLMDAYGNPPFVVETDPIGSSFMPQQINRADLYNYIEGELLEIEPLMIEPGENEYARADRAAVWSLLARLYLNAEVYVGQNRYNEAAEYSKRVIDSGVFSLSDNYSNLFKADNDSNNREIILPVTYDAVEGGTFGGTTFLINAAHGPDPALYGISGGWSGIAGKPQLPLVFGEDFETTKDKRALFGPVRSDGNIWVFKYNNMNSDGTPSPNPDGSTVNTDFPLFRLAEIYLTYSEAVLRGGSGDQPAILYINELRKRAFGTDYPGDLTSITLDELLDERQRELYWECTRRTDLIRFGKFTSSDFLWSFKGGVEGGTGVDDHFKLYPLPSAEMLANPSLVQNPGY
ncbi:RagB/SusD family nutrient uptake outer membrane protein [Flavobacteriaceae bacterium F89]|uniref:RagB/SusD family nutrient uptake outer membrane protein n=1 Tax=Cerina litoralis TaxID=2874477 RepID=A0AAE3JQX6_9FLAO|nr:RagB/SusD family nutrient uptake outer membrane protein [Cerina litoralis]MCG2462359.1 RagB/SusD family nutrient uptake outer membrane protein [Cerina litoralis]